MGTGRLPAADEFARAAVKSREDAQRLLDEMRPSATAEQLARLESELWKWETLIQAYGLEGF